MTTLNKEDIKKFFKFFNHYNSTEIRVFDFVKHPKGKSMFINNEESFVKAIEQYNQEEKIDVYIGARDRTTKGDKNVVSSFFIFVEIDEHDVEKPEEIKKFERVLQQYNIKFSLKVFSGGGYHYYISHKFSEFKDNKERELYKDFLIRFCNTLQGLDVDIDSKVFNLERVTRVAGTYNWKRNKLSKIVEYNELTEQELKENGRRIKAFVDTFQPPTATEEIDKSALEILEKYNIHKKDKWLYEIIRKRIIIKADTGGNSVVLKNTAILCMQYSLRKKEIEIVGKELEKVCEGRTYAMFEGWLRRARDNPEFYETEINNWIAQQNYPLTKYEDKEQKISSIKTFTFAELKQLEDKRDYLIEKIIPEKAVIMLFSPPKRAKSILSELIALCISNGVEFLEHKSKKGAVLILDMENGLIEIKGRLVKLAKSLGLENSDFPLYVSENSIDLKQRIFKEALFKLIEDKEIKLVIFDTLNRFGSFDENSSSDINEIYTNIFKPLKEMGCSVLFLHHTKKGSNSYRGSGDFLGNVDTAFVVKKVKSNFTFVNEENRFGASGLEIPLDIEFKEDLIDIKIREQKEIKGHKKEVVRAFILSELEKAPKKLKEIQKKIEETRPDISEQTTRRELNDLVECGKVIKKGWDYHMNFLSNKDIQEENVS